MMEATLILATIVQRFRLEWQQDRPVVPFPSITLRPKGGVWVKIAQRFGSTQEEQSHALGSRVP
jgi:cytochrome P450